MQDREEVLARKREREREEGGVDATARSGATLVATNLFGGTLAQRHTVLVPVRIDPDLVMGSEHGVTAARHAYAFGGGRRAALLSIARTAYHVPNEVKVAAVGNKLVVGARQAFARAGREWPEFVHGWHSLGKGQVTVRGGSSHARSRSGARRLRVASCSTGAARAPVRVNVEQRDVASVQLVNGLHPVGLLRQQGQ